MGTSSQLLFNDPDRRGDEECGQHKEPTPLNQLEGPEPTGWLIGRQLRVSVLNEVPPRIERLRDPAFPSELWSTALKDLIEHGLAHRPAGL